MAGKSGSLRKDPFVYPLLGVVWIQYTIYLYHLEMPALIRGFLAPSTVIATLACGFAALDCSEVSEKTKSSISNTTRVDIGVPRTYGFKSINDSEAEESATLASASECLIDLAAYAAVQRPATLRLSFRRPACTDTLCFLFPI